MNPYLKKLRERFESHNAGITEIQTRAATEERDLTEAELDSIKNRSAEAQKLRAEIEILTDQENRAAAVATMGATLDKARETAAGITAKDRDPGHYRAADKGGQYSFFADGYRSQLDPQGEAATRLREHSDHLRAETMSSVTGVIPPVWLVDQFTVMQQQDAALWNRINHLTLTDSRPISLPGQTGQTTITTQANENDALVDGDGYNAAAATMTPITIVARETISRQLLDAGNPAVDQLIIADLTRSYVAQRENRIGVALRAVGSNLTASFANFSDPASSVFAYDLVIDAAMFVRKGLFERPTFLGVDYDAFAALLKLKDEQGRPLVVGSAMGMMNATGTATLQSDGMFAGLEIAVSEGMNPTADAADMGLAVVHGPSVLGAESAGMTFRYEEVAGPQSIRVGLWKYFAIAVRQGSRAVKNILVDDDI